MKVIVTCGPNFEPIDQARRVTNFSTSQLGIHLADQLARDGFEVFCQLVEALTAWLSRELANPIPVSALSH